MNFQGSKFRAGKRTMALGVEFPIAKCLSCIRNKIKVKENMANVLENGQSIYQSINF